MYIIKAFFKYQLVQYFSFTLPAMAQQISTGGVIHFRGAIVESPCDVNARQQQIELSCMRDGTTRNSLYNQQQVATALKMCSKLPQSKCTISMNRKTWQFLTLNINESFRRTYAHVWLKSEISGKTLLYT